MPDCIHLSPQFYGSIKTIGPTFSTVAVVMDSPSLPSLTTQTSELTISSAVWFAWFCMCFPSRLGLHRGAVTSMPYSFCLSVLFVGNVSLTTNSETCFSERTDGESCTLWYHCPHSGLSHCVPLTSWTVFFPLGCWRRRKRRTPKVTLDVTRPVS